MKCKDIFWHGCYSGTYDLWSPDSYAHPAKCSIPLAFRILKHLEDLGLLRNGDTILDPMGGIGTTALAAGAQGYPAITVELEEKFVSFQKQNKTYAERRLFKELDWTILKGDSRYLSQIIQGSFKSVMSPPYDTAQGHPSLGSKNKDDWGKEGTDITKRRGLSGDYGDTKGQIGKAVTVTSPPYGIDMKLGGGIDWAKANRPDRRIDINPKTGKAYTRHNVYGVNVGGYGEDDTNIGNLPDKPLKAVMSPPYDGNVSASKSDPHPERQQSMPAGRQYGKSEGQIGDTQSESYLSAMLQVYTEIAKVSDVLVVVVKNPTRNKQLRRLDLDTIRIMEEAGWNIHCTHRALLFEELEQAGLFGGVTKKVRGRMSFFKRLSWQNGSPVASWEDVVIATREGNSGIVTASSPPYEASETGYGDRPNRAAKLTDNPNFNTRTHWMNNDRHGGYGRTPGQIGNLKG